MSIESSTLFKPLVANQPLTILLLIENSQKIYSVWRELTEHYLNPLLDTMLRVNNPALTCLAVAESSVDGSGTRHPPRQIPLTSSALLSVNFNFALDGRISPSRVNDCIQHLDESVYVGSAMMHLIIVAASPPSDDCTGISSTIGNSPWGFLAEKLSERNIHCHLVAVSGEDVTPLGTLFEKTLDLQNNVEEVPPFHVDQLRYIFRLSAKRPYSDLETTSTYAPGANPAATSQRNSHLDSHYDGNLPPSSVAAFTPQNEISLVSQLKLAQGLIKKKQHSRDPQPAPFIADARVQDTTSQPYTTIPPSSPVSPSSTSSSSSTLASTSPPTCTTTSLPLTSRHRKPQSLPMTGFTNVPPETIVSPTNGGRTMSITKADRKQRVSQASSGSSPTESAHMRRASQPSIQSAVVGGTMNASSSPGSWFAPNSPGLPQVHQHAQSRSRLSTPDQDVPMSSPLPTGGLGPGPMNGTTATSSGGGRGHALDVGIGGASEIIAPDGSVPPPIGIPGMVMANWIGNQDISPGSVSSYVSSDMSSPTTPGSTEDLSAYARVHALHHQSIPYQIPYQQNGAVVGSQDSLWGQRQLRPQPSQMQEVSFMQHQEQFPQLHQTAAVPQPHFYPGEYDPTSNYFPPTVPTQQYYLPQQCGSTQNQVIDPVYQSVVSGVATAESIQDVQTQQSSIPQQHGRPAVRPTQTLRHNSYSHTRPTLTASPPPMIVPSQSHVPLTAVNQSTGGASTTMETTRSSPPRPPIVRASTGPQAAPGRTRASTVATSSNLKNTSPSKIAKSKRHKKSASSVSHAPLVQSTIDLQVSSSAAAASGDEIYEVPRLYAASTGVLFESMFNIKSGLLDGPVALANPEDVARVAPALGLGEGPNVLATVPVDTVENAGGLFRSRLKERGGVVDEVSGTALVPVPAATVMAGPLHGDSGFGQSLPSSTDMQSFVDTTTTASMFQPTYLTGSDVNNSFGYSFEPHQVHYGTLNGRPN